MNIHDLSAQRKCTSCQMCAAVCPKDAISIRLDSEGFYRPFVDDEKCVDCNLCTTVCYKFVEPLKTSEEQLEAMPVYAASAKDESVLKETSSGGIADVLARYLVSQGWLCIGVEYNAEHDDARHILASTLDEVKAFRGSKYIQSYTYDAFKEVVKRHLNEKVAIFGTPCQIYAWDLYLKKRKKRDNFLLVDIHCHGCPSFNVWKKYIKDIRKSKGITQINSLTFRSKAKGWGTYHVGINENSTSKKYVSPLINDKFFALFFSDQILNEACADCICRSTMAHTDIRLGDFWGKIYDTNDRGVSVVTCGSPQGEQMLSGIQGDIILKKHKHGDYLPYQSYGNVYTPNKELQQQMLKELSDDSKSLDSTIQLFYRKKGLLFNVKRNVKNLILLLPMKWVNWVKRLYH